MAIKHSTKQAILRWIHIVFGIVPILGYIYSPFDQIPNYAPLVRYVFVPILLLSGYWMYAGFIFGIIGIALWLGAYQLGGYGAAVVSQIALFAVWKIWGLVRARRRANASGQV